MRRKLLFAAPLLAFGLALGSTLTGCAAQDGGTPAVATAGDGTSGSAEESPAPSDEDQARQFAECMRAEGIDIPDPQPGTGPAAGGKGGPGVAIRIEGGGENKAKVDAAMQKCREYLPNGGEMKPLTPEQLERQRELAKCMRANGVPDFPDPDPNGGGAIMKEFSKDSADHDAMRKAIEKCRGTDGGNLTITEEKP
jgi:hypothetical protein